MSRRNLTIIAFGLAVVLTLAGWQQVLIYMDPPTHKVTLWFPLLRLIPLPDDLLQVLLTLIQFPLFAAVFALGIRKWRVMPVLIIIVLGYGLCVCTAFAIFKPR